MILKTTPVFCVSPVLPRCHPPQALDQAVADYEKATIVRALKNSQGHKVKTAFRPGDLPGHPLQQNEKVRDRWEIGEIRSPLTFYDKNI